MAFAKICLAVSLLNSYFHPNLAQTYRVRSFGAVGDGVHDDTQAVRIAVAATQNHGYGHVIFDAGYTFLTGAFNLTSNTILDIQGTILASTNNANYAW